jgi:hypothetical protein
MIDWVKWEFNKWLPFLSAFAKLRKATTSVVMSVCPSVRPSAWNNWASIGRILIKFDIWVFFENLLRKFNLNENLTRILGTLHEDLCTFMIISCWIVLRMRNISDKNCRENQNTHNMLKNIFFRKSCRLWDNVDNYGRARQNTDDEYNTAHAICMLDN